MSEKLLTTQEAADRLGLSKSTLDKGRLTGDSPPFVRMGTAIRYRPQDLDEWVAARVRRSTSATTVAAAQALGARDEG